MGYTYMQAISVGFPGVECHSPNDGAVYADIIWDAGTPLPEQSVLDLWIDANPYGFDNTKITVLAFRNRFTQAEKVAIDLASIDNQYGTVEQRQTAAWVRVMLTDLTVARYIDIDREDTIAGVRGFETYGILAAGRADEILNTPTTTVELSPNP